MTGVGDFDFAVFDCDGVLLDSNAVKTDAFRHALAGFPLKKVQQLVAYHRQHGGVSRYDKFRYFFNTLVGNDDEEQYKLALERFKAYCQRELANAPIVPGVAEFLGSLKEQNLPMFVVSGSDQNELRAILKKKQLSHYFQEVLGSPVSKRDNLELLLAEHDLRGRGVFFGDARLDFDIATEQGLEFVYIFGFSDWSQGIEFCEQRNVTSIPDFRAIFSR